MLLPICISCACACRPANNSGPFKGNKKFSQGWLGDQIELDKDLAEKEEEATEEDVEQQSLPWWHRWNKLRRSWIQFTRVEVWLARHGVLFSFCALMYAVASWMVISAFELETIHYADKNTVFLAVAIPIGRACGIVTNFSLALVILFMARLPLTLLARSALNVVFPFGNIFELHRYAALFSLAAGTVHGVLQTVNFAVNPSRAQTWNSLSATHPLVVFGGTSTFITGWLILAIFLVMSATFYKPLKLLIGYQGFLKVHWLWIPFLGLMLLHGNEKGNPVFWMYILGPGLLLLCHYLLIVTGSNRSNSLVVLDNCILDEEAQVVRLEVLRGNFSFRPGQYAFLSIKDLGSEFHPFTIASAPNEDSVTFFIKVVGDWTKALFDLIRDRQMSASSLPIKATLSGPYGAPTEFAFQFENIVLVGTGVGATPFISLLRDILWLNGVKGFLREESYKLCENPARAKLNVEEAKGMMTQLVNHKRCAKKRRTATITKWKLPNSYSYGVFWILYITFFVLVFRIHSVQTDLKGFPHGHVILYSWYILGALLVLLYICDIAYRIVVERSSMPRRQFLEIMFHALFMIITAAALICKGVNGTVTTETGYSLVFLGLFSTLGWFLYINRISGLRSIRRNRALTKDTKAIKFIYVDRCFENASWITKELEVLAKLAKELDNSVQISFDLFFTRDKQPPETLVYAHSAIITVHCGRPDWETCLQCVVNEWNMDILEKNRCLVKDGVIIAEEAKTSGRQGFNSAGMFFCGSPIVATALRRSANMLSITSNWRFVWHQESFA